MSQDDWLNFWFKPYLFMHDSWVLLLDEKLLNRDSSALAWHLSFDYLCECYCLPQEYLDIEDGLIKDILGELLKDDKKILDMACMMISSVVVDENITIATRRKILRRNRALSLKKRFLVTSHNLDNNELGIYFVFFAVTTINPELWSRFRLLFPKDSVEKIEQTGKEVPHSLANISAIRRAWKEIFNLKRELELESVMINAKETMANIDAEVENDTLNKLAGELYNNVPSASSEGHIEQLQTMTN